MNSWIKSTTAGVAVALAGMLSAQQANAGCTTQETVSAALMPALYLQSGDSGSLIRTDYGEERAVIVGLWKFAFTAKGNSPPAPPDGVPIDAGFVTWHDDGTELTNSGREPLTGSENARRAARLTQLTAR